MNSLSVTNNRLNPFHTGFRGTQRIDRFLILSPENGGECHKRQAEGKSEWAGEERDRDRVEQWEILGMNSPESGESVSSTKWREMDFKSSMFLVIILLWTE